MTTLACDGRTFIAVLAQLAAYRLLSIVPGRKAICLTRLKNVSHLSGQLHEEEKIVFKDIFEWEDAVELTVPSPRLMEKIQKSLQDQFKQHVTRNFPYIVIALVLSGAATAWMCVSLRLFGGDLFEAALLSVFTGLTVSIFAAFTVRLWGNNLQAIKLAMRGLYHRRVLLFLAVLVLLCPAIWYGLLRAVAPAFANVTASLILVNMLAAPLLHSYTASGRRLMHDIRGFRQFLQIVEQDRLQRMNPPDQPIQAGQEFVAYAIALDVREDWGDQLGIKAMVETVL